MKPHLFLLLCFVLTPLLLPALPYSAPSPADLSGSFRRENAFHTDLYLNGIWEIAPTLKTEANCPADSEFHPVPVPSSWMFAADFPIASPDFVRGRWSGESAYRGIPLQKYESAWYRRKFIAPQVGPGEALMLAVDRVSVCGSVWLNGEKLGDCMERSPGLWDITSRVRPGKENLLLIRVDAAPGVREKMYMGAEMTATVEQKTTLRGITQDVRLVRRPAGLRVDDLFLKTSTRKGEISFELRVANPERKKETVAAEFQIFPEQGDTAAKRFPAELPLSGEPLQTFHVSFPWRDAHLWETDDPFLYRAEVSLSKGGREIEHSLPRRFGFREVWIEGRETMLNGKPFRVITLSMPNRDAFVTGAKNHLYPVLDLYRKAGYNAVMISNEYAWRVGGCAQFYEDLFDYTDRNGMLVSLPLSRVYDVNWESEAGRKEWLRVNRDIMERYRNQPSLVFWSMNFNLLGYPWDLNPYAWASDYRPPDAILDLGRKRRQAGESEAMVRAIDDSRIVFHHAGGNFGSMITSNFYISWPPLQERMDYPEPWSKTGVRPFNAVELGYPNPMDYSRCRDGSWQTMSGAEPMEAEYSAPYLSRRAYQLQEDRYLAIIDSNGTEKQYSNCDFYEVKQPYLWDYNMQEHAPVSLVQQTVSPAYVRVWRAYGVNGFCPWVGQRDLCGVDFEYWKQGLKSDFSYEDWTRPGAKPLGNYRSASENELCETGKAYRRGQMPLLVWAGGSRAEGFSSPTHAYYAGETVERQLVVVNDTRRDLRFEATWRLGDAEGTIPVAVKAGTRAFLPFSLKMPQVESRREMTLDWRLKGVDPAILDVQETKIEVFPADRTPDRAEREIVLFDPAGMTAKAFDRLHIPYRAGDAAAVGADRTIVIGRGSLKLLPYPVLAKILVAVDSGAALVVMAQDDLSVFGLRLHPRGVRNAFRVGDPALLAGLAERDLADWRGGFSFLAAGPNYPESAAGEYPEEPFRRGNRGSIASMMLEKPHTGAFRHLIEAEFDLDYALLSEVREGRGRILFCQLDLAERAGEDPVATLLLRRLAAWSPEPAAAPLPVRAIGKGAVAFASRLGLETTAKELPNGIVLAEGTGELKQLVPFAEQGGTVLLLGPFPDTFRIGDATVASRREKAYRAAPSESLERRYGVGYSELFLKAGITEPLIQPAPGVELLSQPGVLAEVRCGKGKFLLAAVNPERFRDSKISPERMTRAAVRLGRAIAEILAGEGARFPSLAEKVEAGGSCAPLSLSGNWKFHPDPENRGYRDNWQSPGFDDRDWREIKVPGYWENQGVRDPNPAFPASTAPYDGYAWYRYRVVIPESFRNRKLFLNPGVIDDMDRTFFNGKTVGMTGINTKEYWSTRRSYALPPELVKFGEENVIAIKVYDNYNLGGIVGPQPELAALDENPFPYTDRTRPFNPYRLKRW